MVLSAGEESTVLYCTAFELFEIVFLWDVTTLDTVFFDSQIESWMALHSWKWVRTVDSVPGRKGQSTTNDSAVFFIDPIEGCERHSTIKAKVTHSQAAV